MQGLLFFAVIVVLSFISWEDFNSRTVHAFWFPVVLFLAIGYTCYALNTSDILFNVLCSGSFLIAQVLFLSLYFAVKNKRWVNITQDYLGWGDVLFLLAVLPFFSTVTYVLFYLISLMLTIIIVLFYRFFSKGELKFIPLAGIQSIMLVILLAYHQLISPVLTEDFLYLLAL